MKGGPPPPAHLPLPTPPSPSPPIFPRPLSPPPFPSPLHLPSPHGYLVQVFQHILAGQSEGASAKAGSFGVQDAASFEKKQKALQVVASSMPKELGPWNRPGLPNLAWRLDPSHVTWPLVFTHICEQDQVSRHHGSKQLQMAALTRVGIRQAVVTEMGLEFMKDKPDIGNKPHTVVLTEAVLTQLAASSRPQQDSKRRRVQFKTPPLWVPGEVPVAGLGWKGVVRCPNCGARVRRDGMARHMASVACRHADPAQANQGSASDPAKVCKTGQVTCKHCGSQYEGTQQRRHLNTRKCIAARASKALQSRQ